MRGVCPLQEQQVCFHPCPRENGHEHYGLAEECVRVVDVSGHDVLPEQGRSAGTCIRAQVCHIIVLDHVHMYNHAQHMYDMELTWPQRRPDRRNLIWRNAIVSATRQRKKVTDDYPGSHSCLTSTFARRPHAQLATVLHPIPLAPLPPQSPLPCRTNSGNSLRSLRRLSGMATRLVHWHHSQHSVCFYSYAHPDIQFLTRCTKPSQKGM
jgi:hypothetical protein